MSLCLFSFLSSVIRRLHHLHITKTRQATDVLFPATARSPLVRGIKLESRGLPLSIFGCHHLSAGEDKTWLAERRKEENERQKRREECVEKRRDETKHLRILKTWKTSFFLIWLLFIICSRHQHQLQTIRKKKYKYQATAFGHENAAQKRPSFAQGSKAALYSILLSFTRGDTNRLKKMKSRGGHVGHYTPNKLSTFSVPPTPYNPVLITSSITAQLHLLSFTTHISPSPHTLDPFVPFVSPSFTIANINCVSGVSV